MNAMQSSGTAGPGGQTAAIPTGLLVNLLA
jgi:hypothetical protein